MSEVNTDYFNLRYLLDGMVFGHTNILKLGFIPFPLYIANYLMSIMEKLIPVFAIFMLIGVVYNLLKQGGNLKQALIPEVIRIVTIVGVVMLIFSIKDTNYKSKDGQYMYGAITLYSKVFELGEDLADALFYELVFNGNGNNYSPFGTRPTLRSSIASINPSITAILTGKTDVFQEKVNQINKMIRNEKEKMKMFKNGLIALIGTYNLNDVIKTYFPLAVTNYLITNNKTVEEENNYYYTYSSVNPGLKGNILNRVLSEYNDFSVNGQNNKMKPILVYKPLYMLKMADKCAMFKPISLNSIYANPTVFYNNILNLTGFRNTDNTKDCYISHILPLYKTPKDLLIAYLNSLSHIFADYSKKITAFQDKTSDYMDSQLSNKLDTLKEEMNAVSQAYSRLAKGIEKFGQPNVQINLKNVNIEIQSTLFKVNKNADVFARTLQPVIQHLVEELIQVKKDEQTLLTLRKVSQTEDVKMAILNQINVINREYWNILKDINFPLYNPLYQLNETVDNVALGKTADTALDQQIAFFLSKAILKPNIYYYFAITSSMRNIGYNNFVFNYVLNMRKVYNQVEIRNVLNRRQININLQYLKNKEVTVEKAFEETVGYSPFLDLLKPTTLKSKNLAEQVLNYLKTGNPANLTSFYQDRVLTWVDLGYLLPTLRNFYSKNQVFVQYLALNLKTVQENTNIGNALKVALIRAYGNAEEYEKKYTVMAQIKTLSEDTAGFITIVKGFGEIWNNLKSLMAGLSLTLASNVFGPEVSLPMLFAVLLNFLLSGMVTAGKLFLIYIFFYFISAVLLFAIYYLIPSILWMLAVFSWYFKAAILMILFPINLMLIFFRDKTRNVISMLFVLFGQALVPVTMVAIFFIVITFSTQISMIMDKMIPATNHFFLAGILSHFIHPANPPAHFWDIGGWIDYLKAKAVNNKITVSAAIALWGTIMDTLKDFVLLIVNIMLYFQFFKTDNFVGEILGERVEAQAFDANRILATLRVSQFV